MQNGDRVKISGEVIYGNASYRVSSEGTILEIGKRKSLVNIDYIDGDGHANVYVNNKIMEVINNETKI